MKALIFIVLLSSILISHSNSQVLTRYSFTEGPSIGRVTAILIDNEDNKWIGTRNGVHKFDGTSWITYNRSDGLPDSSITAIEIDNQGNIWFGTDLGGVSKFDGTSWTTYDTLNGLVCNYVTAIAADGNNIWVGTQAGISRFDGKIWQSYLPGGGKDNRLYSNFDVISAIGPDGKGNVWFGAHGAVMKFDGDHWEKYFLRKRQVERYARKREMDPKGWYFMPDYHSIVCDPEGTLWFGDLLHVLTFDGKRWTVIRFNKGDNEDIPIVLDSDGNKWFGNDWSIMRYDGIKWIEFEISSRFEDHPFIEVIDIDSRGDIWMGINGGIIKFDFDSAGLK